MKVIRVLLVSLAFLSVLLGDCSDVKDSMASKNSVVVLEDTVFIGDRVLDVANMLRIMPKFASARFSQWDKSFCFKTKRLGCPNKTTRIKKDIIPNLIDKKGVKKIVVEKTDNYCLLMKQVNPMDIMDIIKNKDVNVTVIDFSKSEREGIIQTAKYLGKEKEGIKIANNYEKELKKAKESMKGIKKEKRVVVLKAFTDRKTKKFVLNGEAKGFYTDKFFLDAFGAKNVSDLMNKDNKKLFKGGFPIADLENLIEVNPDVIILLGNKIEKVKEKLLKLIAKNPKFTSIPAIKNNAIADNLEYYMGNDIENGPKIILEWVKFFKNLK